MRDQELRDAKPFLVIIQCDSGHLNSDLIACARYRVCDEAIRAKAKNKIKNQSCDDKIITHVLFVIRLPQQETKSQFVGFQGDPWISVHIDDLRPTSRATVIPEQALNASISEIFIGKLNTKNSSHNDFEEQLRNGSQLEVDQKRGIQQELSVSTSPHDNYSDLHGADDVLSEEDIREKFHGLGTEQKVLEPAYQFIINSEDHVFEFVAEMATFESGRGLSPKGSHAVHTDALFHPQHYRLLGCVQAAVSMLNDSQNDRAMHRIQTLMALIPKKPEEILPGNNKNIAAH